MRVSTGDITSIWYRWILIWDFDCVHIQLDFSRFLVMPHIRACLCLLGRTAYRLWSSVATHQKNIKAAFRLKFCCWITILMRRPVSPTRSQCLGTRVMKSKCYLMAYHFSFSEWLRFVTKIPVFHFARMRLVRSIHSGARAFVLRRTYRLSSE